MTSTAPHLDKNLAQHLDKNLAPQLAQHLAQHGWVRIPKDPKVLAWADAAKEPARKAIQDPAHAHWDQCGGTWFVGVDVLPNDAQGRLPGGPALTGAAMDLIGDLGWGDLPLHRGQVSVMRPGYPLPRDGETGAGFRYRQKRDAAHLDGLRPVGPQRLRKLEEPHAYILGLPLTPAASAASPLVVWQGSHHLIRAAFHAALSGLPDAEMRQKDVTQIYQETRRRIFDTCPRITLSAQPGECTLVHRMALHGVAPWQAPDHGTDPVLGRAIVYFRPECPGGIPQWLAAP